MTLRVLAPGPLATVQDQGRPGHAHLGVPRAGALDRPAAELANRLVGNPGDAAVIEATFGGLEVWIDRAGWCALTGAHAPAALDGRALPHAQAFWAPAGARLGLAAPPDGVRTYLALAGGIAVEPVLGSRSTDVLAGVGPAPLRPGDVLPLGAPVTGPRPLDVALPPASGPLRVWPGPRADWCVDPLARLCAQGYRVGEASNRVGLRLEGPAVAWRRTGELASEGVVLGSVQVPPDGQPVIFLADHPTTGGYPVVAVLHADDVARCAQLRPGAEVGFSPAR